MFKKFLIAIGLKEPENIELEEPNFNSVRPSRDNLFRDDAINNDIKIHEPSEEVEIKAIRTFNEMHDLGLVIKEETTYPSSWRSKQSLNDYLASQNIVSIKSIDTRALTRHIRDQGAMNGIISSTGEGIESLEQKLKKHPKMEGLDLAKKVTTKKIYKLKSPNSRYRVSVVDFGVKRNILNLLIN